MMGQPLGRGEKGEGRMHASGYFERMVLGTLRGQAAAAPAAVYLALLKEAPAGDDIEEVDYEGYARQRVTFAAPAPMEGGTGIKSAADVMFPAAEAACAAGALGLMDAPTGGNLLLSGALEEPLAIEAGDAPVILAGEARWWMSGHMTAAFRERALGLLCGQGIAGFVPHLALLTGDPEAGGVELSGGGYARVPIAFGTPTAPETGATAIENAEAATLPRAEDAWGAWAATALFDAAADGSPVLWIPCGARAIRAGTQVTVPAAGISVRLE